MNMMSDHTTIKTRFSLGPLVLKVEKEFGRAAKKELRSATATTAEMSGKLSLRVLHGGAATLHSIRVLQPKQVRISRYSISSEGRKTRETVIVTHKSCRTGISMDVDKELLSVIVNFTGAVIFTTILLLFFFCRIAALY